MGNPFTPPDVKGFFDGKMEELMKLLIKGGRVIDPMQQMDSVQDVLIESGVIKAIGTDLGEVDQILDAAGCIVAPGLIDMHVHLREPGFEYKETLRTGTRAAAAGGVTTVACMPNTKPVIHNAEVVRWIKEKAESQACVNVEIVGSITRDLSGSVLADIKDMLAAGIVAISDDGKTTMDDRLMEEAMILIAPTEVPLISHAEDHTLSAGGAMHEGNRSQTLGIPGIPSEAEWRIIDRDIRLAEKTGAKLHIAHISTREGVELVRTAKRKGLRVTAEAGPHHFLLSDDAVTEERTETKVNPPLRTREDVEAVIRGLIDGTIDVIATDHAPHDADSKLLPYTQAAFGISGIESSLALSYTELVLKRGLSISALIALMSTNPAAILGLHRGTLVPGTPADVIVIDPDKSWIIDPNEFESKGKNTPFAGTKVQGFIRDVLLGGELIKQEGKLIC